MIQQAVIDAIKREVSAYDIARQYGLDVNQSGFACCPFHGEKTASMRLYQGNKRGFYCFGCHKGGGVVDLVMGLLRVDFPTAVRTINNDFHLGYDLNHDLTPAQIERERKLAAKRKAEQERLDKIRADIEDKYDKAERWLILLCRLADHNRPTLKNPDFNERWAFAQRYLPEARETFSQLEYELRVAYGRS